MCRSCVPQMKRTDAHAEAPVVERLLRGPHDPGWLAEAEVVVGAEVQHRARPHLPPGFGLGRQHVDAAALRREQHALALVQPLALELLERRRELSLHPANHGFLAPASMLGGERARKPRGTHAHTPRRAANGGCTYRRPCRIKWCGRRRRAQIGAAADRRRETAHARTPWRHVQELPEAPRAVPVVSPGARVLPPLPLRTDVRSAHRVQRLPVQPRHPQEPLDSNRELQTGLPPRRAFWTRSSTRSSSARTSSCSRSPRPSCWRCS